MSKKMRSVETQNGTFLTVVITLLTGYEPMLYRDSRAVVGENYG